MIAMECEKDRRIQSHISKIVMPIFEKVLIDQQRKENYPLRWWMMAGIVKLEFQKYMIDLGIVEELGNLESIAKAHFEKENNVNLIKSSKKTLGGEFIAGTPDFFYKEQGNKIFVEIKCNGDSLRENQMEWCTGRDNLKIIVAWFNIQYILLDKYTEKKSFSFLPIELNHQSRGIIRRLLMSKKNTWGFNDFKDIGSPFTIKKYMKEVEKLGYVKQQDKLDSNRMIVWERVK